MLPEHLRFFPGTLNARTYLKDVRSHILCVNGSICACNAAQKCVKTGKLSDLFPINRKNINTRPHEKFHVTKAKTARLAKSSVPYLQRLLNQN